MFNQNNVMQGILKRPDAVEIKMKTFNSILCRYKGGY